MAKKSAEKTADPEAEKPKTVVELARERFEIAKTFYSASRQQAVEDTMFAMGDSDNGWQWPEAMRENRETDPDACLTINLTAQHCNQIINAIRQNRPAAKAVPVDSGADKRTAEMLGGLIRNIRASSNGDDASDTAAEHAIYGGEGYWRIVTEYESAESFDQVIKVRPIPNPMMVYVDPFTHELDKSDAMWGFVMEDISRAKCRAEHPGADPSSWIGDTGGWVTKETVRRAEYFYCELKDDEAVLLVDGTAMLASKAKEKFGDDWERAIAVAETGKLTRRQTKVKKWTWCKLLGGLDEPLDAKEWLGEYLPIISVIGKEVNVNGEIIRKGLVRDLKDAGRMVNYSYSAAVTTIALQNKIPYLAAAEAIAGWEAEWANANTSKAAYLPFNAFNDQGEAIPSPRRQEPAVMPAAQVQMLELSITQMRAVSGQQNANFGIRSEASSGIGIQRLKQQGEVATFHFPDNLTRAMRYEAKVLIDLIQKYYDTKRVVRILGLDNKTELATLDPGAKQAYIEHQAETAKDVQKIFNPTLGKYDVVIDTGPDYMTQRQEAFSALTELAGQDPTLMQKAGDIIVRAADFPMADQLADRLERSIPPELRADDEKGKVPPQVAAQMEQMQQQMQQMGQMLDAGQQELTRLEQENQAMKVDHSSKAFDAQIKSQEIGIKERELGIKERESELRMMEAQAKLNAPSSGSGVEVANLELAAKKQETDDYRAETERLRVQHDAMMAERAAALSEAQARADHDQESGQIGEPNGLTQQLAALQCTIQALSAPKRKVARFTKQDDGSWAAESVEMTDTTEPADLEVEA